MAYIKNTWVDREGTTRYFETTDNDGAKIFTPDYSEVTEIGTPVNADNMNHIEEGIAGCDLRKYNSAETFEKGEWVTGIVDDTKGIYESLANNNYGNPLTDETKWQKVELGGSGTGGLNLFDLVKKDYILPFEESKGLALLGTYVYKTGVSGTRYGYPDFYNKCVEEKNAGTETEVTLGSSTITMYVNANGHQFYNIADKAAVDAWYNTYGVAYFFGIDEENERIFLPRKDAVLITPKTQLKIYGDGNALALTNDSAKVSCISSLSGYGNAHYYVPTYFTNAFPIGSASGSINQSAAVSNGKAFGVIPKSLATNGITSGLETDTFSADPNAYVYMVVGNTTQQSAITDVVDVTTSENDTIPLGFSTYQANAQPSVSWLASNGQWNSGNVYTTFYNYYVNKIGEAFANGFVKEHTDTYDDYDLVINEDDMTFRLPLLNGSESIIDYSSSKAIVSGIVSGFVAPSNGYIIVWSAAVSGSTQAILKVNGKRVGMAMGGSQIQDPVTFYALVKRGDIVTFSNTNISYTPSFFPMKGNGTLYFKVANAVQNLELMNAGAITEALANKIDNDAFKSYQNGTSGYVIFPNNYCIQWGQTTGSGIIEVPLLKNLGVINVILAMSITNRYIVGSTTHTTSSITFTTGSGSSTAATNTFNWCVMGYVA